MAATVSERLPPAREIDGERLREVFAGAGYTADGVNALLGPVAHAALARGETVPALRATAGGGPLATLVRVFLLYQPVGYAEAVAAITEPAVAAALGAGLLQPIGTDRVRAALDVRPYGADDAPAGGWWVVSDLGAGLDGDVGPLPPDHVPGVGGASTTLAQLTPRLPVRHALDIGTGCGVQALHLGRHSGRVTATDVSPRALHLARLTSALCGLDLDLREGSLWRPVAGERFDLVVSNPPFVIGGAGGSGRLGGSRAASGPSPPRLAYRDSGLPGDELCRLLLAGAPRHLAEGGSFAMLGNWLHRRGEAWTDRVGRWLPDGHDYLVVQREVQDPAAYVGLWLRDAGVTRGPVYRERYDEWLAALEAAGVEAVGFGFALLRHTGQAASGEVLDWPHPVEQPLAPHLTSWFERRGWLRETAAGCSIGGDDGLLGARLRVADDVVQEQLGRPGAEDPERLVLRQQRGLRRAYRSDTATAALVGACDGSVPVGALMAAVATVLREDAAAVGRQLLPAVRELVGLGILEPVR